MTQVVVLELPNFTTKELRNSIASLLLSSSSPSHMHRCLTQPKTQRARRSLNACRFRHIASIHGILVAFYFLGAAKAAHRLPTRPNPMVTDLGHNCYAQSRPRPLDAQRRDVRNIEQLLVLFSRPHHAQVMTTTSNPSDTPLLAANSST